MKAIIYTKYGPPEVLQLKEVEKPVPKENEVLVKIIAASANPADWHMIRGEPVFARVIFGLFKPKKVIPGIDIAGQVEAVGKNVKEFIREMKFLVTPVGVGHLQNMYALMKKDWY